tara:strand:+ start:939 stop:1403 length:465 start_codon:yes stop_codon:yes gene_type:complete
MSYLKLFLFVLLMGCKSQSPQENPSVQGKPLSFEVLIQGSHSNMEAQAYLVLQDHASLQKVFSEINKTRKPSMPVPDIDFSKKTVLFLNMGQSSTGGHHISVGKIIKTEASIDVYVEGKSPKPGENVTMVITQPFVMVSLDKQSLPFEFKQVYQ